MNDVIVGIIFSDTWPFIKEISLRLNNESEMLATSHVLRFIQIFLPHNAFGASDSQAQVMRFAQEHVVRGVFDLYTQPRRQTFLQIRASGIQQSVALFH